jgi:hypothetical protein
MSTTHWVEHVSEVGQLRRLNKRIVILAIRSKGNNIHMTPLWHPQWTTQVRIESGGKYPLGENRLHEGLEAILIKGIIEAANRLRYVTYCCWIIGDIENNEKCLDYSEFVTAFTRRENALALGLYLIKPGYTVSGSNAMSKIIKEGKQEYDCGFRLMQSEELGAFGLYYSGTTFNWGLTEINEKGIVRLTPNGKIIHNIMDQHYQQGLPEYYRKFKGKKIVPTKVLIDWATINNFNNITKPCHKKEREFYKSVIFHLERKQVAGYRRDTFAFVMECINKCQATGTDFNEDILRNIHYYSSYVDSRGKIRVYSVPKHFSDVHFYWCLYEGHVYFRWWLSKYFDLFLNHLKSCNTGSTLDGFLSENNIAEFNATINYFGGKLKDFYNCPMASVFGLFKNTPTLVDKISEEFITHDEDHDSLSQELAKFVLIMTGLYIKFKPFRSDKRYQYVAGSLNEDLWFNELYSLGSLDQMAVKDFLKVMLKRYIINQHDLIMIGKKDLRRCWFTTENKRYFHQADVSLIWRPAKFETIMNFLGDMNFISSDAGVTCLSKEGISFYEQLMKDYY